MISTAMSSIDAYHALNSLGFAASYRLTNAAISNKGRS